MVGATRPEGAHRFHGRGKRVAQGGVYVRASKRELEGERGRYSQIEKSKRDSEREKERKGEER